MNNKLFIITAANGNATAIEILKIKLKPLQYVQRGIKIIKKNKIHNVEQCGFLIPKEKHFEMSGGEFCGNAARAAAIIFSQINNTSKPNFTISGYKNKVKATVKKIKKNKYDVLCVFPKLKIKTKPIKVLGQKANLVDLGGIVHIVIKNKLPNNYKLQHRQITNDLGLTKRDAVGVCWITEKKGLTILHPVVWVKAIDSFFYEGSCGSGAIATAKICQKHKITQPSGQVINVKFNDEYVSLQSEMEVIHQQ